MASSPAIARPAGVVRSSASVSETKPTPRCSEVWSADPSLIGPSDPGATPAPSISRRRAAFSSFSRASRRAAPEFTSRTCIEVVQPRRGMLSHRPVLHRHSLHDHSSKRGRTNPPGTFWIAFVPAQKRSSILLLPRPVLWAFQERRSACPQSILSGHMPDHDITLPLAQRSRRDVRDSSRASMPTASGSAHRYAAAVRSSTRMDLCRSARRCG